MKAKFALNISKVEIPASFRERIKAVIPKEHLKSHPMGTENRIFEEFIYDLLLTFKNDISAIFIDEIKKQSAELANHIKGYAKENKILCLNKEDGDVAFVTFSEDIESFLKTAKATIKTEKETNIYEEVYFIIPLKIVTNAYRFEDIEKSWRKADFYKNAFRNVLEYLKGYAEAVSEK